MAGRRAKPPRTSSKATKLFFEALEASDISRHNLAREIGIHANTFHFWSSGKSSATLINVEAALEILGFEFTLKPIEPKEDLQ